MQRIRPTDAHPLSPTTGQSLRELRNFLAALTKENKTAAENDDSALLSEWSASVLESLPDYEPAEQESTTGRTYTVVPLVHTNGERTYRLHVRIDDAFGDLLEQVKRTTSLMLERVAAGRSSCFIARAKKEGLTHPRKPLLPFPHTLPYLAPAPTEPAKIYAQEAVVIAAAFHFAFSQQAPGIELTINAFEEKATKLPSGKLSWVLGSAVVNLYNDERTLRIRLNTLAFPKFRDDVWASTIAHEIMHNLGWGHPDGGYDESKAIVNYDLCIRGSNKSLLVAAADTDFDDTLLIR